MLFNSYLKAKILANIFFDLRHKFESNAAPGLDLLKRSCLGIFFSKPGESLSQRGVILIGNFPRVSVAFCQQSYSFEWGGGCSWVCWWCGRRESAGFSQSRLPNSTPECGSATHVGAVQPISTPHFPSSTDPPAPGDPLAEIYPDTLRKAEISRSTKTENHSTHITWAGRPNF